MCVEMGKASTKFGRPKQTRNAVDNGNDWEAGPRPAFVSGEMVAREGRKKMMKKTRQRRGHENVSCREKNERERWKGSESTVGGRKALFNSETTFIP